MPAGQFDPEVVNAALFDPEMLNAGLFDKELVDTAASGPITIQAPAASVAFSAVQTASEALAQPAALVTMQNPSSAAFAPTAKGTATYNAAPQSATEELQSPAATFTAFSLMGAAESITQPPGSFVASAPVGGLAESVTSRGTFTASGLSGGVSFVATQPSARVDFSSLVIVPGLPIVVQSLAGTFTASRAMSVAEALQTPPASVAFSAVSQQQQIAVSRGTVTMSAISTLTQLRIVQSVPASYTASAVSSASMSSTPLPATVTMGGSSSVVSSIGYSLATSTFTAVSKVGATVSAPAATVTFSVGNIAPLWLQEETGRPILSMGGRAQLVGAEHDKPQLTSVRGHG